MAGSRPGAGHMAGVQNNARNNLMELGQQGAPLYDRQYSAPNTTDNVTNKFNSVIDDNVKLQDGIKYITKLSQAKLMELDSKLKEANAEIVRLKEEFKNYSAKLVEASQNYENAKVVVLTYKTKNIRLQTAADELEKKLVETEELKKNMSVFESQVQRLQKADMKNAELIESINYAEEKASKAQQEVNQLQQTLRARAQEIDKLNMVMRNVAEHSQLPPDRLQWMMDEAWRRQEQSEQSLLQKFDELNASLYDRDIIISQLEHQINELQRKKTEAETFNRIKGKNISTEKIESQAVKLDNALMCIDKMGKEIEELKAEVKRKDGAVKGLQDILKKEQQSHQEKLRSHDVDQQKNRELTQTNEKMRKKIEELNQKCEQAQVDYAILKSVDLNSREELQRYKETVISLEHDLRRNKQVEADLYKELDEALKDLEDVSSRYRSLQNENAELKTGQSAATFSGMDDSQLVKELAHKTAQVEILHGQIKTYSDSLDKEKRKVSMLTLENQNYQRQLQQLQGPPPPLPPRSHNYPSMKTQPMPSNHRGAWEGATPGIVMGHDMGSNRLMPGHNAIEPSYYSEGYKRYDTNAGRGPSYHFRPHPQDRALTVPQYSGEPYSEPGALSEPCPLCGKKFSTTEQLTVHASHCNFQQ